MTDALRPDVAESLVAHGLNEELGFEFIEVSGDKVVLEWDITPKQHQPFGIVHGGVYCSAVETAASLAAFVWLNGRGQAVGVSNHTDFLRSVSEGRMRATATPIHRGRSQQLWLVDIVDQDDKLTARGQVRLQNLTPPN